MINRILSLLLVISTLLLTLTVNQNRALASTSRTEQINYRATYRGHPYEKHALVYLPAGYNRRQRYNVIYLLHGSTESAKDFFTDGNFHHVLDHLMATGQLKPSIVVFPTYYPSRRFVTSNYYHDNRLNKAFAQHELVDDLVPAVEGRYHTYANGTSRQALHQSRRHRAFGGFSMGSITTWYVFQYQLPFFSDFLPIAGDSWTIRDDGGATAPQATARRLNEVVQTTGEQSFRIFAGVGSADSTSSSMSPQIRDMRRQPAFNRQNLEYYHVPGGTHSPRTVARAFSHYAPRLFH